MVRHLVPWMKDRTPSRDLPASRDAMDLFHSGIDGLIKEFFGDRPFLSSWKEPLFPMSGLEKMSPRFEVTDSDTGIQVKAELPGLEEKDLHVELDGNVLTVSGEKKEEKKEEGKRRVVSEVTYGRFERSILLPDDIDPEKVKATFRKGVLTLDVERTGRKPSAAKKIQVET